MATLKKACFCLKNLKTLKWQHALWKKVLPASNKKVKPYHYIILCVWLTSVVVAAVYFIRLRLVPFDPDKKLQAVESNLIIEQIQQFDSLANVELSNTIIHFTSNDCHCTQFSEAHKKAINKSAGADGFNIVNVHLDSKTANSIIPSTPSVLLVDKLGELLYFGPYSQGLACSKSNGFIEIVLSNYKKGFNSQLVMNDTEGCYCNT